MILKTFSNSDTHLNFRTPVLLPVVLSTRCPNCLLFSRHLFFLTNWWPPPHFHDELTTTSTQQPCLKYLIEGSKVDLNLGDFIVSLCSLSSQGRHRGWLRETGGRDWNLGTATSSFIPLPSLFPSHPPDSFFFPFLSSFIFIQWMFDEQLVCARICGRGWEFLVKWIRQDLFIYCCRWIPVLRGS